MLNGQVNDRPDRVCTQQDRVERSSARINLDERSEAVCMVLVVAGQSNPRQSYVIAIGIIGLASLVYNPIISYGMTRGTGEEVDPLGPADHLAAQPTGPDSYGFSATKIAVPRTTWPRSGYHPPRVLVLDSGHCGSTTSMTWSPRRSARGPPSGIRLW